MKTAAV